MTRHAAFSLLFALSPLFAGAQDAGEKTADKPVEAEKADSAKKEAPSPQIHQISVVGDLMAVSIADARTGHITPLSFEADKAGNKLVSVSIEAETKRVRVVAMLDGQSHTISQKVSSVAAPVKSPASGRGPSDDDRKKYESLSEDAKEKFRDGMRKMFADDKFRSSTEDERRAAIRTLFDEIQKEDQASRSKL